MFIIIKTIHGILKLLNSETSPIQMGAGIAFGMILGLTPLMSLHNLVIFLLVCLLRVNFSMFFLSWGWFSVLGFLLDPIFDGVGYWALVDLKSMRPFWIQITSGAIWPFFRFNNTIVMGSLLVSLILLIPVWILSIFLVKAYRAHWREQIRDSKFMKVLKATPLYGLYDKYQNLRQKFGLS